MSERDWCNRPHPTPFDVDESPDELEWMFESIPSHLLGTMTPLELFRHAYHRGKRKATERAAGIAEDAIAACRMIGLCRCPVAIAATIRHEKDGE